MPSGLRTRTSPTVENSNFTCNNIMQTTIRYIKEELMNYYTRDETSEFIKLIFYVLKGYSLTDLVLKQEDTLPAQDFQKVYSIVKRLQSYEPVQFILGQTEFCGLIIKLNQAVLIPRPETEELVLWIHSRIKMPPFRILDMGTGSGCIALALKKYYPDSNVSGCDNSEDALMVAKENARFNYLNVNFFCADILNWENYKSWGKTDMIVSNPPYVTESEKIGMNQNVIGFEPHHALFVPDKDPLVYYRRIAEFSREWLTIGGKVFFEINERFGMDVVKMLESKGFGGIEIHEDIHGKHRMVCGIHMGS
jgi:release factor glutamine methyltransferase